MATAAAATQTALYCSFCLKPASNVEKLIAGPGVYICDGCVALCNAILADEPAKPFADLAGMSDDALLASLRPVAEALHASERGVAAQVRELRSRNVPWSRIGEALGISRQAAWERFSGEE